MTTTIIRIDYAALSDQFNRSRPDAIEAALRENGTAAERRLFKRVVDANGIPTVSPLAGAAPIWLTCKV